MWIFTNRGCFSIVESKEPGNMLVRSRIKGDIERVFPGYKVLVNAGTDYKYRALVPRDVVAEVLLKEFEEINYPNFKNSCDKKRASIYGRVWGALYDACEP